MKKRLLWLAGILLLPVAALAGSGTVNLPDYVATVQVTPGASPARVFAFQNVSATLDVLVRKIELVNSSTQTVSSGLEQFWVYASTSLTHSLLTTVDFAAYGKALAAAPAAVSASTAPINVQFEGDSGILTLAQQNSLSGAALPILRPMAVNLSNTATSNLSDSWTSEESPTDAGRALLLPAGSNRAIVIEKRQLAASDFSAGVLTIRVFFSLR